jgi:hypothetical protein
MLTRGDETGARRSTWGKGGSRDNGEGDRAGKREARSVGRVHMIAEGAACVRERIEGNCEGNRRISAMYAPRRDSRRPIINFSYTVP